MNTKHSSTQPVKYLTLIQVFKCQHVLYDPIYPMLRIFFFFFQQKHVSWLIRRWISPLTREWCQNSWRAAEICCWSWSTPTSHLNPMGASTTSSTITPTQSSWPNCTTPVAPSDPASPRSAKDSTNWWKMAQYDREASKCQSDTGRTKMHAT